LRLAALTAMRKIAMINVDDVQEGVKELERCAKMDGAGGRYDHRLPPLREPGQNLNNVHRYYGDKRITYPLFDA